MKPLSPPPSTRVTSPAPPSTCIPPSLPPTTIRSSLSPRSEEHTSELQSRLHLVCRLLLEKKKTHAEDPDRVRGPRDDHRPRRLHPVARVPHHHAERPDDHRHGTRHRRDPEAAPQAPPRST